MKRNRQGTTDRAESHATTASLDQPGKKLKVDTGPRTYVFRGVKDDDGYAFYDLFII